MTFGRKRRDVLLTRWLDSGALQRPLLHEAAQVNAGEKFVLRADVLVRP